MIPQMKERALAGTKTPREAVAGMEPSGELKGTDMIKRGMSKRFLACHPAKSSNAGLAKDELPGQKDYTVEDGRNAGETTDAPR